ncbi:Kinase [Spironucleus salmonicida]|uniref:Kinase n=1 Tax=Spironucleus salmonicida TaxID=348837 RepID=V6LA98_9EUKA|nr:Kinase [Spironucleus salmonicida]|eukprot:EST41355.1 Kinase [Spironucleus salmonicida]
MEYVYHPKNSQLLSRLGAGSHATVYKMKFNDEMVAYKLFSKQTPEILKNAQKEAKFLSYMTKFPIMKNFTPNFIQFSEKPLYIIMEYIEGNTLNMNKLTDNEFNLLEQTFHQFISQLHTKFTLSIRDISPYNIIHSDDRFIFIDFEQLTELKKPYLTNYGTPKYAAPTEICDEKDDFLSAAIILSLRFGEVPWGNLRKLEHINQIKKQCILDCKKYFSFLTGRPRQWMFGFSGVLDEEQMEKCAYIDYRTEFSHLEGL